MKRLRLAVATAAGLGLAILLGFLLVNGNKTVPEGGAVKPFTVSVDPHSDTSGLAEAPVACSSITVGYTTAVTAGSAYVLTDIRPASSEHVTVKSVVITVVSRRSVPAAEYDKCAKAALAARGAPATVPRIVLPSHGSVQVPLGVVRFNGFGLDVLPPVEQPKTPTAYAWYVSVTASTSVGLLTDQSDPFVMLVAPAPRHGRR